MELVKRTEGTGELILYDPMGSRYIHPCISAVLIASQVSFTGWPDSGLMKLEFISADDHILFTWSDLILKLHLCKMSVNNEWLVSSFNLPSLDGKLTKLKIKAYTDNNVHLELRLKVQDQPLPLPAASGTNGAVNEINIIKHIQTKLSADEHSLTYKGHLKDLYLFWDNQAAITPHLRCMVSTENSNGKKIIVDRNLMDAELSKGYHHIDLPKTYDLGISPIKVEIINNHVRAEFTVVYAVTRTVTI